MLEAACNKMQDAFNMTQYKSRVKDVDAVLLNTPLHGNLGDHAIALCEEELFSDLNIKVLDFQRHSADYEAVAKATPEDKLIFISGGGYLGDLWPIEEYKVRDIIKAFAGHKIIIFPQTVSFDLSDEKSEKFFEESKSVYSQCPDLTLFVREQISYDFIRNQMPEVKVKLVPDMAMLMKYEANAKREGVVVCLRDDKERSILPDEKEMILQSLNKIYSSVRVIDTVIGNKLSRSKREKEVSHMLDCFAGSELVVTDRLHGMIFASVTSTPCIVINSKSHKIRGCYEWMKDLGYIKFADNTDEISGLTESLKGIKPVYNYERIKKAFDPLLDELKIR